MNEPTETRLERMAVAAQGPAGIVLLLLSALAAFVIVRAPADAVQGVLYKILFVHAPAAFAAYLGFVLTAVGGIGWLSTRKEHWDHFSLAAAEVGVVFCTLGLITGPIWAKPVWGHWWEWDLRLTSTLVLWFIYVAYLFLRAFVIGSDPTRTFASVYGIVGTAAIPFVYYAVDLARGATLHPSNPAREGLPGDMLWTLLAGIFAFLLLFTHLVGRRMELARLRELTEGGHG